MKQQHAKIYRYTLKDMSKVHHEHHEKLLRSIYQNFNFLVLKSNSTLESQILKTVSPFLARHLNFISIFFFAVQMHFMQFGR